MKAKRILLFVVIAGIAFLAYKAVSFVRLKDQAQTSIQRLPDFSFKGLDNVPFSKAMLLQDAPVVFILFSTECDHCAYEAGEIKKNIARFAHCNLLMISQESIGAIRQFDSTYRLSAYANVHFLRDDQDLFYRVFRTRMIPSIFIYGKNGVLVKQYLGEAKIEAICKYL